MTIGELEALSMKTPPVETDSHLAHLVLFEQALNSEPRNIREHLVTLSLLAAGCEHVTEFGTSKGISTSALLLARPQRLVTYDILQNERVTQLESVAKSIGVDFEFKLGDTAKLEAIEPTDMLFIDSQHTEQQLREELRFALFVRRYLVFHDTQTFGLYPEVADRGNGLLCALLPFLRRYCKAWSLAVHYSNNNGLTVLERRV